MQKKHNEKKVPYKGYFIFTLKTKSVTTRRLQTPTQQTLWGQERPLHLSPALSHLGRSSPPWKHRRSPRPKSREFLWKLSQAKVTQTAKEQFPLVYLERFQEFSDPKLNAWARSFTHSPPLKHLTASSYTRSVTTLGALLGSRAPSGRSLLMEHKVRGENAQKLRHSSKSRQPDAEMLGEVPWRGAGQGPSHC